MAAINLSLARTDTVDVVDSIEQLTLIAAEAMGAGSVVKIDTAGKFAIATGSTSDATTLYGVTTRKVPIGMPVTAVAKGVLGGFDCGAIAYGATVYAADADSTISDTAGTVSVPVGQIVPGTGTTTGTAYDKLLRVKL